MNQTNSTVSGNGNARPLSIAIEDSPEEESTATFYDSANPEFLAPKQVDVTRKRGRKRKLVTASVILVLVLGGLVALYLLLRVNSVNVKVQPDPRRKEQQRTNEKTDSISSDTGLTAEAINIARSAAGSDGAVANPASSASASPSQSSSPVPSIGSPSKPNYSATDSPALAPISESGSKNDTTGSSQSSKVGASQAKTVNEVASNEGIESRANPTQTLFVDDSLPRSTVLTLNRAQPLPRDDKRTASTAKIPLAVLPPFGTMLPVRTQGVIFTLRNNSYARLELTRDSEGVGWSLPKGTILVGRVSGNEYDRAFVTIAGYLDSHDNKFVKITGEVLGGDGASGIQGKRVVVNQDGLNRALRKVASGGLQVAGMMAGALTGRGTVVIDSAGYRLMNPITDEAGRMVGNRTDEKRSFVKVEAGRPGYVMIADLPKSAQAVDAPGDDELARTAASLTDREVMELILFGTPEEIRAAQPLMNDEQKRLASKTLNSESEKR